MLAKSVHLSWLYVHLFIFQVCKEAKADLAFLVDGSWSIGDDNFMKITRFLYSTMGSLDLIGPDGTQVSHVTTPISHYLREEKLKNKTTIVMFHLYLTPFSCMRHYKGTDFGTGPEKC